MLQSNNNWFLSDWFLGFFVHDCRTRCKVCSKLTIKILKRPNWRRFGVLSHTPCCIALLSDFEHINVKLVKF